MNIKYLKELSPKEREKLINRASAVQNKTVQSNVANILSDVKKNGDKAIKKYVKKFNKVDLETILVSQIEIQQSYKLVNREFIQALKQSAKNISLVCQSQLNILQRQNFIETSPGISISRFWRSIEKVGLYIPGGKAVYPSTVLMTGIPAKIAGCKNIIICSPPNQEGLIPAPILVAANLVGIEKIYKVGGAEAIGAMAYGTGIIPKVSKIFGPGNTYVNEAKIQISKNTAIDLPAGPSEVFIIADENANSLFIAADLLADCEHGNDSSGILLTTSEKLAESVCREIDKQIKQLGTGSRIKKSLQKYGLIGIVKSLDEAINFCNEYAPEHLEIQTKNPESLIPKIVNAGSILLGVWTSKSAADYITGANHVLPTGGQAKTFSCLSVESFGKYIEVQKIKSQQSLSKVSSAIQEIAEAENLPAHKNATAIRLINLIE